MSKATGISLKPFQQKSYLVPKIKAKPADADTASDVKQNPSVSTEETATEVVPLRQDNGKAAAPITKRCLKRKAESEKLNEVNEDPQVLHDDGAPCAARARATRSRSTSVEPQQESAATVPDAAARALDLTGVGKKRRSRPAPTAVAEPKPPSPAIPSAKDVDISAFADGDEIFRYMKLLGSTVDDVLGDDDEKPAGGRRGNKEKRCTPLKEKLHKSWGGRGYMERLDIVMAQSSEHQLQSAAEESEDVFKPMFLGGGTAAASKEDIGLKAVTASPMTAEVQLLPNANACQTAPSPLPSLLQQNRNSRSGKTQPGTQASNRSLELKQPAHMGIASSADPLSVKPGVKLVNGKGISAASRSRRAPAAGHGPSLPNAPTAVTPILPSVNNVPARKTNHLVGPKGTDPKPLQPHRESLGCGGQLNGIKTSPLPAGAVVWLKEKKVEEGALTDLGEAHHRGGCTLDVTSTRQGAVECSSGVVMGPPSVPASRQAAQSTRRAAQSSQLSRPGKVQPSRVLKENKAPLSGKRDVFIDNASSSWEAHQGNNVAVASGAADPAVVTSSPMIVSALETKRLGKRGGNKDAIHTAVESDSRSKIACLENIVSRLQEQEGKRALEDNALRAENKELQAQVEAMVRQRKMQDEELAASRSKALHLEEEIKQFKLQLAEKKAREKSCKEASTKIKKMLESAATVATQLTLLTSSD